MYYFNKSCQMITSAEARGKFISNCNSLRGKFSCREVTRAGSSKSVYSFHHKSFEDCCSIYGVACLPRTLIMSFYLQVLSSEGIDSSACIVVFTESHRFMFNCGEGIQRLCVEHKVRLSKIRAVMFSEFSPQNVFGLPGSC